MYYFWEDLETEKQKDILVFIQVKKALIPLPEPEETAVNSKELVEEDD